MRQKNEVSDEASALLEHYGFADLPETFAMRNEDGSMIQERDPCYICRADGFYGKGTSGTFYDEGSIIVLESTPNEHLEPLNQAAALRYVNWVRSLPSNRAPIDIGDMSEAATMLSKSPSWASLDPVAAQKAVIKLSEELKIKREGKDAKTLPSMGHNFAPQSGGKSPPILGAKMSDMSARAPGETKIGASIPQGHSAGVRRGMASLGGNPPV